jgi:hypothetical protein
VTLAQKSAHDTLALDADSVRQPLQRILLICFDGTVRDAMSFHKCYVPNTYYQVFIAPWS